MYKNLLKFIYLMLFSTMLVNCSKTLPPGEYDANEVGKVKKVIPGMILSKRPVSLHRNLNPQSQGSNNNFVDNGYGQSHGIEYVIRLNSGGIISVVQAEDLKLKAKQKILVIYGKNTRVVADNGSEAY
jgi:outer membrane lipoprotein SlyB